MSDAQHKTRECRVVQLLGIGFVLVPLPTESTLMKLTVGPTAAMLDVIAKFNAKNVFLV